MNKQKLYKCSISLFWLVLIVISAAGILKTIYIGADIDESYAVTMARRLVKGDRLFVDMWELHQTSAVLYAPLVWIFEKISGSTNGLLIFLRFTGVLIQGALALFVYDTFKHVLERCDLKNHGLKNRGLKNHGFLNHGMNKTLAFVLAIIFFNSTPKQVQSPEYTVMGYWAIMLTTFALVMFYMKSKRRYIIISAVGCCVLVLSYPTAIILFPLFILLVFYLSGADKGIGGSDNGKDKQDNDRIKYKRNNIMIFAGVCIGLGILFLIYVLSHISLGGLIESISYVLMDESHEQALGELLIIHVQYLWEMLKIILPVILLVHIGKLIYRRIRGKDTAFFGVLLLCFQVVYSIYQFHTIQKVNFLIVFPIILQVLVIGIYFYAAYEKSQIDKILFRTIIIPNICFVAVILMSSNLTANYSMAFLIPGTLVSIYMIGRVFAEYDIVYIIFTLCFCFMILTVRVFLVRYTSTQRVNIFVPYYETHHGVIGGIRLGDLDYRQYDSKITSLYNHVTEDDVFLYVGADMYLYGETKAAIGTGNTISTPAFGEQLFEYYKKYPQKVPTVIFIDCQYVADYRVWLEEELFGSFINENYGEPIEEGPLWIYKAVGNK